ncbi:MAG: acetyltransferase [Sphingomonadales bacterium]|nr:acetyltransferase [Sphingomonadales bacterium]
MRVRAGTPADVDRALAIWRAAVDATHGFLSAADRAAIEAEVAGFLPLVPLAIVADDNDLAQAFMIRDGDMVEALFVDPAMHGKGLGSLLLAHARQQTGGPLRVDANLQADNALPFYAARGFVETGRSDRDGQGRPYAIVHLRQPS